MSNIFDTYSKGGRQLLGQRKLPNGKSRIYPGIVKECGTKCVYCSRDLREPYESWLDISNDHVIPKSISWAPQHRDWINDKTNLVTCCRACNEFLNKFEVKDSVPIDLEAFYKMRDRVLEDKSRFCEERHAKEREQYEIWKREIGCQ